MIDKLKALFDGKESVTAAEFDEATKGMKLVDLKDGGYVAEDKLEREVKAKQALADKVTELEKATGGDEELKAKITKLEEDIATKDKLLGASETKATRIERERIIEAKLADKRFTRFALSEIETLVDDSTTFDEAAAKWLEDNPDYAPKEDDGEGDPPKPPVKVGSGNPPKGKPSDVDDAEAAFTEGLGIKDE